MIFVPRVARRFAYRLANGDKVADTTSEAEVRPHDMRSQASVTSAPGKLPALSSNQQPKNYQAVTTHTDSHEMSVTAQLFSHNAAAHASHVPVGGHLDARKKTPPCPQ